MGQCFTGGSLRIPRKATVKVFPIKRGKTGSGLGPGHGQGWDQDEATMALAGVQFAQKTHNRYLPWVFIAMIPRHHQRRGTGALLDDGDGYHEIGPTRQVIRIGDIQVA